jgi:hypothetical protein
MTVNLPVRQLSAYWKPDEFGLYLTAASSHSSGGSGAEFSLLSPAQRAAETRKPQKPRLPWAGRNSFANLDDAKLRFFDLSSEAWQKLVESVPKELREKELTNGKSSVGNKYYRINLLFSNKVTVSKLGIEHIIAARKARGEEPMLVGDDADVVWRHSQAAKKGNEKLYATFRRIVSPPYPLK